ncbi:MAG: F0F1 ATP synthase subunit B [Chloroflexi bacterium]|nr:F0F1 ATP synthase subunit B [Chloroflexota bacterium]
MEKLGIHLPSLVVYLMNFLLLLGLLYLFAYKPILKMLDQRSARIREGLDRAEAMKQGAESSEQRIREQLEQARREGQGIVQQAAQVGERLKEESRQEARQEAERIMVRARAEIQVERDQALEELRREFADVAIMAAEKVIRTRLDKETHRRLIEETLEEARGLKGTA